MGRQYYVYILTNARHTVLYIGVTNDLVRRVHQHRLGMLGGFTQKYRVRKLVYFEIFQDPYNAIAREKQLKAGPRRRKIELIRRGNAGWQDLAEDF